MEGIPSGFEPIDRQSPYLSLMGPIFNKKVGDSIVFGFRAEEKHCNARGFVHGGVLSGIADVALGHNSAFYRGEFLPMVTASLTIDFAGSIKCGEWVEIETDVQKVGANLAFANCYFVVESKRVARASSVFHVVQK